MECRVGGSINAVETLSSRHSGIIRKGIQSCTRNMVVDPIDRARISNACICLQIANCDSANRPYPRLCLPAIRPEFPFAGIRMIEMKRNNIGPFRWNGRGSFGNAAPRNQPGNCHLRPDHGNCRIDPNGGRLVDREILRHLRTVSVCRVR